MTNLGKLVEFTVLADIGADPTQAAIRSSAVVLVSRGTVAIVKKADKTEAVVPISGKECEEIAVVYLTTFTGMHIVVTEPYADVMQKLRAAESADGITMYGDRVEFDIKPCTNCKAVGTHEAGCVLA